MKKNLLLLCFIAFRFASYSQPYGNEWITDYSKAYYKINVSGDGIYRIPYNTLQTQGLTSQSASSFVLYHNGKQVPIYVSWSGTMTSSDYIEFYGEKNRGYIDSLLYRSDTMQINPEYSLFTDVSVYYLTTNNLSNNLRFVEVPNDTSSMPPESFFMHKTIVDLHTMYYAGKYFQSGFDEVYKSIYDVGEGYTDGNWVGSNAQPYSVPTPFVYTQTPVTATLKTYFANNSGGGNTHRVEISLNGNQIFQQPFPVNGFQLNRPSRSIPASQLVSGTNTVSFQDFGTGASQHKNIVGYIEIEYPHTFDFGTANEFSFRIEADANKKYLEITSFDQDNTQPVLYDITNGLIYRSVQPPNALPLKFELFSSVKPREMFLRANNASTYNVIQQITPVSFIDFLNPSNQGEYFIITESKLRNDGTGYDPVNAYRTYRDKDDNLGEGKYFHSRIVDIETLYDQFGYGIRKSPLAIRNFINYAKDFFSPLNPLKYVFIIGKGRENPSIRTDGNASAQCLVPTFGFPGSDNLLGASRNSDVSRVAIGRLAAENTTQVKDYLDKMEKYETQQNSYFNDQPIPPKDWQKKILHFSGGTGESQQGTFRNFVYNYSVIATDTSWGADTTSYSKKSSAPIDASLAQIIKGKINEGVSWITFFGHSATSAFDFSIDEPENYDNSPKFPIILSNGCFSGFVHDVTPGYSERFVLAPDKAAIAFMATSGLSLETGLHNFSNILYKNICDTNYLQPLGKSFQQTFNTISCCSSSDNFLGVAYEMTLHGDPGLLINQYPKPDYAIDQTSVYFNPPTIQPGIDSFDVHVIVTNLGRAIKDSIAVTLNRTFYDADGNAQNSFYRKDIPAPYYKDTVIFTLPVNISNLGYGDNRFNPYVEADLNIDEMAEGNNGLLIPVSIQIQNDDIIPIYPYEFAIVPDSIVTLKASTVNPFAPARNYRFEIDTSEEFIPNPLYRTGTVFQEGGVVHWPLPIVFDTTMDSMVFYWRVAKDSVGAPWHYSSFIYLKGEFPGWNQSHQFQWLKDEYQQMRLDSSDRIFKFPSTVNNIKVLTGWSNSIPGGTIPFSILGWDLNNAQMHRWRMGGCGFLRGITFAVIDTVDGVWTSLNMNGDDLGDQFLNTHCASKPEPQYGFDFGTFNSAWSQRIETFINAIPSGAYVLAYSTNNMDYSQWDAQLVQALNSIGFPADSFTTGNITGPFIYFTQKGNSTNYPNTFVSSDSYFPEIQTTIDFNATWYKGQFTSPKIGPAVEWGSVHWRHQPSFEIENDDIDTLDVIGVDNNGVETVLLSTLQGDNYFNGSISATSYPYLRLRLRTRDDTLRTPTQLIYWRVLYKKPPEAAINPAAHFYINPTINLGDSLHVEIGLENVTDIGMTPMQTKYTIRDANNGNHTSYIRYGPLGGLDTMHLVFKSGLNGNYYEGLNKIIIEANPDNDQLEQYHFNNFAEINFTGVADKINPLLDVTFDGQHILNGDIVSAKPNILITLKDENKYLALDTDEVIQVYLKYPGETNPRKIEYDNSLLTFYPADANNLGRQNKAYAEFKPVLPIDGIYELIVKDRDRSFNNSATTDSRYMGNVPFDYKIAFEVINKPMITNVLNYPNPFTTSTKFVFTITGSEVPDIMKIQIITIKGTVVKEIMKDELGDLHVGRNITTYAWDGRDQYGDILANGVYFYHVVARLDEKRMDHLSQSYDKYFKKGFGKLVIVR